MVIAISYALEFLGFVHPPTSRWKGCTYYTCGCF